MGNEDWIFRNQKMAVKRNTRYNKGEKMKAKADYQQAYNILMEYWDSLPDNQKEDIDKRLKRCGV